MLWINTALQLSTWAKIKEHTEIVNLLKKAEANK